MKRNLSKEEYALCNQIAERSAKECGLDKCTAFIDITICHSEAHELDLKALLEASDADFIHDVIGINRHLCHESHQLKDCFTPRFAKQ